MATTSHIDYRKINYDQVLNQPIINTTAEVDTLTSAGVYNKGDGKRYIVSVNGQTITQTIEEKDGYKERTSTDGGTTRGEWVTVVFSDTNDKWDKVVISQNEPSEKVVTTAWLNTTDDSFNIRDGIEWHTISGTESDIPVLPTFTGTINGTTTTLTNQNIEDGDGVVIIGVTNGTPEGSWSWEITTDGQWTITSTASEDNVSFKYIIIKEDGLPFSTNASNVIYENTDSGLTATNVQDAIDEINEKASESIQVDTLPTPASSLEGKIYQYVGATTQYYTNGYFYKCVESSTPGTYEWINIDVQDSVAANVSYDNTNSELVATNVQAAIDEMNTVVEEIKDIVEVETMPTPSEDVEGTIIQYKGTTTASFTHGYFYECVESTSTPGTYEWVRIDVQPAGAVAAEDVSYDNTTSGLTATNVQDAIDEIEGDVTDIKNIVEVTTMDAPSEDNEGSIVQYKGATNANFTHGYFYECVSDGAVPPAYSRENIDVQTAKTTLVDLEDTNINNPQNGDVIKYDSTTQKYVNAPESGGISYTSTSPYKPKYHWVGTQAQYDALQQYYTDEPDDTIYMTI